MVRDKSINHLLNKVFSWTLFAISVLLVLFYKDTNNYIIFGILILLVSLDMILKSRKNYALLILVCLIGYINSCVAVLDCFCNGSYFGLYQQTLRAGVEGLIYIKCFLLLISIVNLFLFFNNEKQNSVSRNLEGLISKKQIKDNFILFYSFSLVSLLITITMFNGSAGGTFYQSNTSAIFEYVPIFLLLAWMYSGRKRVRVYFLVLISLIYMFIGLLGGDRSSSFMLILLLYIMFAKKVTIGKMLLFSFAGILLANIVAEYRTGLLASSSFSEIVYRRGLMLFFSDTSSASFYSGITIVAYSNSFEGDKLVFFLNWLRGLLLGGSGENIVLLAQKVYTNGGGGMFPAYFYFFGGFFGVVVGAVLLGCLLRFVFSSKKKYCQYLKVLIIVYSFRWYLYNVDTLIRAVLINSSLLYIFCYLFDCVTSDKVIFGRKAMHD